MVFALLCEITKGMDVFPDIILFIKPNSTILLFYCRKDARIDNIFKTGYMSIKYHRLNELQF